MVRTFNAIDVETANSQLSSICQIGIVHICNGTIIDEWKTLVNPEVSFSAGNIRIHGITQSVVADSPIFPEIHAELLKRVHGSILVAHTSFDKRAIAQAVNKYKLEPLQATWLDSCAIARWTWPERKGAEGFGLKSLARDFGIAFQHHDALEDARTAAEVVLRTCDKTDTDISGWLRKTSR